MEQGIDQIRILEQDRIADKDAFDSICAYDESDKHITVTVTVQALKDLKKFDCSLNEIALMAVENALERGQTEGRVLVSTETPTFQDLTARFRTVQ